MNTAGARSSAASGASLEDGNPRPEMLPWRAGALPGVLEPVRCASHTPVRHSLRS